MTSPLSLRQGAYYRRRDGKVVGPVTLNCGSDLFPYAVDGETYTRTGNFHRDVTLSQYDLVARVGHPRTPKRPRKAKAGRKIQWVKRWAYYVITAAKSCAIMDADTKREATKLRNEDIIAGFRCGDVVRVELPSPAPARKAKIK